MKKILKTLVLILFSISAFSQLKVAHIFGDHMVLQRDKPIKIWGWNSAGENVNVSFNGQQKSATTDVSGNWQITLDALAAGGPLSLSINDSDESKVFSDILMGDVWLCSGQSNMEFKVANVENSTEEIKNANYPNIRHIEIPKALSFTPEKDFEAQDWKVCSPETAGGFTAVGYFFARRISQESGVPIGLVHSSWGGSHVETWISKDAMLASDVLKEYAQNMPTNWQEDAEKWEKLTIKKFEGNAGFDISKIKEEDYLKPNYDFSKWTQLNPMGQWDWKGVPGFRGSAYLQKDLEIPDNIDLKNATISFGYATGDINLFINGIEVGSGYFPDGVKMAIPKDVLKNGKNSILVKISENRPPIGKIMGIFGQDADFFVKCGDKKIQLEAGNWNVRPAWQSPRRYEKWMNNEGTLCYNAMIAPIVGFSLKGALWYQGESNASRAYDYRKSFPLMINNWRQKWGEDFPFFFVQLSSYGPFNDSNSGSDWAELREAQLMTLSLPNTGMAVTTDIGNPKDIHPTNKQDVGDRLAQSALHVAYRKNNVPNGPDYKSMAVKKGKAILSFNNVGNGLEIKDKFGYLKGFEIVGADKKFYFAKAEIVGNTVVVYTDSVKNPVAVRYGWSDSPTDANLFNKEGLPASPFRTDNWKGLTENTHFE